MSIVTGIILIHAIVTALCYMSVNFFLDFEHKFNSVIM